MTHEVCPCEQLSLQVAEHAALGACPPQVSEEGHIDVDAMNKQWSLSLEHVATVWRSWQAVPAWPHIVGMQAHAAFPPVLLHAWCMPHVVVVTHSSQPLEPVWHVCTPVLVHCVLPELHALTQDGESLASPDGASVTALPSPPVLASLSDPTWSFAASPGSALSDCGIVASVVASGERPSTVVPSAVAGPS
jgi:hypothetical protein